MNFNKSTNPRDALSATVAALKAKAVQTLGDAAAARISAIETDAAEWGKPGSVRYLEIVKGSLESYIDSANFERVFIPASPETLEWGGFLGGEWVTTRKTTEDDPTLSPAEPAPLTTLDMALFDAMTAPETVPELQPGCTLDSLGYVRLPPRPNRATRRAETAQARRAVPAKQDRNAVVRHRHPARNLQPWQMVSQ